MTSRRCGQHTQVEDRLICHRVGFQIVPDIFRGIQLRRIGRKELGSPGLLPDDIGPNQPCPVGHETIP